MMLASTMTLPWDQQKQLRLVCLREGSGSFSIMKCNAELYLGRGRVWNGLRDRNGGYFQVSSAVV